MDLLRKFYMADPGSGGNTSDEAGKTNEQFQRLKETVGILKDSFESIGKILKNEINNNLSDATRQTRDWGKSIASGIESDLKAMAKSSKDLLTTQLAIADGSIKEADVLKRKKDFLLKAAQTEIDIKNARANGLISLSRMRSMLGDIKKYTKEQLDVFKEQRLYALQIENSMGNMGKVVKGLNKIPLVGELINADKVLKRMQETAAAGGGKLAVMGAGLKETFKTIGDSLTDLTTLVPLLTTGLIKLVKLAAEFQSKQFEAAKDLGVSVERGKELRQGFIDLARANASLGVTADQLQKSYAGVQDQLGFIVKQSQEFNLSTALIERRIGASAENMALLQFAAKKTGDTLMGTYKTISGITKETGARVKLELSEKQVLEEVGKVSATVYQNFNGNFKALTAAVIQAKALGTTLDKINATQDQFLDFESSIAKQFEAEVLSGEQLDLTRARQLALNHDTKGLMLEINKLVGDNAHWNQMDSITQRSKAEALGLSRDAVAEMLRDQEKANVLGAAAGADLQTQYEKLVEEGRTRKQIVDTLGQQAAQSAQQASVSEKLAATLDAIKNTIAQSAATLLPMVDKIATWLSHMENLRKVFTSIAGIIGGIVGYSITMSVLDRQRVATQIQLLQLQVAQNVQLQRAAVAQGFLTKEEIVGAEAAVIQGSGYLGIGALAVGAAVAAYFADRATSGMGGGGSQSVAEFGGGGGTPTIPTTGMSTVPTVAPSTSTNSATYSATGTNVTSRDGKSVGDVYLDGSKVGQIVFKTANQQQLNMV